MTTAAPPTPGDAELLHAWGRGDKAAGNALVARHFDAVYSFFRIKIAAEVDDLVQRTFLACAASHTRLREGGSFRAYLFAIARNEFFAALRRQLGGREVDLGASSIDALAESGSVPTPVSRLAAKAEQILLLRALRRLPLDDQIALELCYWKGLRAAEVGEVFGVPASTIRTRLSRARAQLEGLIRELEPDARLVDSTIDGFERWSASLQIQRPDGD